MLGIDPSRLRRRSRRVEPSSIGLGRIEMFGAFTQMCRLPCARIVQQGGNRDVVRRVRVAILTLRNRQPLEIAFLRFMFELADSRYAVYGHAVHTRIRFE